MIKLLQIYFFGISRHRQYFPHSRRLALGCTIILTISLLIFLGQPKFIFQPYLHIPWLTNVHHVKSLKCIADVDQPGWPRVVHSSENFELNNRLTIIILTVRSDFKRLPLTMASLVCHLDYRQVSEVIILVPLRHVSPLKVFFAGQAAKHWPWPISIMSDDKLLKHAYTIAYRLQMIFKLMIAQVIKTEYYMILDSDCVALWPIHVKQLLWQSERSISKVHHNIPSHRALYQLEERSDHFEWWPDSEKLLQIEPNQCVKSHPSSKTIGVTPAILSKSIALRTLCRLQKLYGKFILNEE